MPAQKEWKNKDWQERMGISLHFTNMMAGAISEVHGIADKELDGLKAKVKEIDRGLRERRKAGELPFYDLPYQKSEIRNILKKVKKLQEKYDRNNLFSHDFDTSLTVFYSKFRGI